MFCANCGQKNSDGVRFCPSCGSSPDGLSGVGGQALASAVSAVSGMASQVGDRAAKASLLFTFAIACYIGFWSLLALFGGGGGVIAARGVGSLLSSFGLGGGGGGTNVTFVLILIFLNILGAFGMASAYGLIKRFEWARQSTMTIATIWVALNIIGLFFEAQISGPVLMLSLLGAGVNVCIVLYLRIPLVKAIFAEAPSE